TARVVRAAPRFCLPLAGASGSGGRGSCRAGGAARHEPRPPRRCEAQCAKLVQPGRSGCPTGAASGGRTPATPPPRPPAPAPSEACHRSDFMSETGVSCWSKTVSLPRDGALGSAARADVCVVGAGIAGLTTAYLLARAGKKVVVLEAGPTMSHGETQLTTA